MATTKIMLIRHAEKPYDNVNGVTLQGDVDAEDLIVQGWQRAGALIGLFSPPPGQACRSGLATPQHLYASGIGPHSKSLRPQHTLVPLAGKLGQNIDTTVLKGGETELARRITTVGGVVLVAWEHQDIPAIAAGIAGNTDAFPSAWPGERFDLVWVFDRPTGTGAWRFSQVPQLLLADDLVTVLPIELAI